MGQRGLLAIGVYCRVEMDAVARTPPTAPPELLAEGNVDLELESESEHVASRR